MHLHVSAVNNALTPLPFSSLLWLSKGFVCSVAVSAALSCATSSIFIVSAATEANKDHVQSLFTCKTRFRKFTILCTLTF